MKYAPIDPALFVENRQRLAAMMKPNSIAIIQSNDIQPTNADGEMPFRQNSDMLYLAGADQEQSILVLYPDAPEEKFREMLFLRETSELIAIWEGEKLTKERAMEVTGIQKIHWLDQFEQNFRILMLLADHVYLNLNEHARAAAVVETRERRFIADCQSRFPLHHFERLAPLLHTTRAVKSPIEIDLLQKACDITESGFRRVLSFLKPGVGEWEVEAEFAHEFLRRRSKGFAYQPIIATGRNACVLHYYQNHSVCQDGDVLLLDVGAEYGNYNADMTRSVPVNGKFTERQRAVYNAVLRVLRGANAILRPGVIIKDYQEDVGKLMEAELLDLGLITKEDIAKQDPEKPAYKKYFMHGTSHHLGLDVHDVGATYRPVEEGMVYTIEPGIYIPDENLGIRLEDDILIGKDGNTNLMGNIPIEADEIEALMAPS
jgi:Xaa-Pro aminopeptidase